MTNVTITIEGDNSGEAAGRDINKTIIYEGDTAYDVRGLENPYLGLAAFTYAERARYAGREAEVQHALKLLTTPGSERPLLFITGASGSGKSSFAQAGLLPALEAHYQDLEYTVDWAIFRPGEQPLAGLARALRTLKRPATGIFEPAAEHMIGSPPEPADTNQIAILIIDQFEEIFTQSNIDQGATLLDMLTALPPFRQERLHVLTTIRADYLRELFEFPTLYEIAKRGIDLRAMDEDALNVAIQRPLQVVHPDRGKRFQHALLNELTEDATEDAALLPLLQVTLDDLWRTGILTANFYVNLTDAIRKRADQILTYKLLENGEQVIRSQAEQEIILTLFLDLVDVALDDNAHRDVRRTRRLDDVVRGRPQVKVLMQELTRARLLITDEKLLDSDNGKVETVDIIHESLIGNWSYLSEAIQERRSQLQQRSRFEIQVADWEKNERREDFLLQGVYLAEAEKLYDLNDVSLQGEDALHFLTMSLQQRDRLHREELDKQRAIAEERTATANRLQRRNYFLATASAVALLLAVAASILGFVAERRSADASSRELAANALLTIEEDPLLSVDLATEALQLRETTQTIDALREALHAVRLTTIVEHDFPDLTKVAFNRQEHRFVLATQSGQIFLKHAERDELIHLFSVAQWISELDLQVGERNLLAVGTNRGKVIVWDLDMETEIASLQFEGAISALALSPDGKRLAIGTAFEEAGKDTGAIRLWDLENQKQLTGFGEYIATDFVFMPDQEFLIVAQKSGAIDVLKGTMDARQSIVESAHNAEIITLAMSPDGKKLATGGRDRTVIVWDISNPSELKRVHRFYDHLDSIFHLTFNLDGSCLLSSSADKTAIVWNLSDENPLFARGAIVTKLVGHTDALHAAAFLPMDEDTPLVQTQPCGPRVTTVSSDRTYRTWNIGATHEVETLEMHSDAVMDVAVSSDARYLATASVDGTANILKRESEGYQPYRQIKHGARVDEVHFSGDNQRVLTASWDGTARLIDIVSGAVITLTGHTNRINSAAFHPSEPSRIVTAGNDGTVIIWQSDIQRQLESRNVHSGTIYSVQYSADGTRLLTAGADGFVKLLDQDLREIQAFTHGNGIPVYDAIFHPDAIHIVTAAVDGLVRSWSMTDDTVQILVEHKGAAINELDVFESNGQVILATAGGDRTSRLWDMNSYQRLTTLPGHLRSVNSVTFNQSLVFTAGHDGTVRIYWLNLEDWLQQRNF